MKSLVTFVRIVVGVLFIFSGLVKANDPMGLSYKMQEFFEVWELHGFNGITLLMSVLMNSFEIIAGFALLIGWQIRLFIWLLLALIISFTFLTGYTVFTGNPKNCGCFGDCLPITSFTSFMKDVVLLVLILFLLFKIKFIKPVNALKPAAVYILVSALFCVAFQWYTLNYLPVIDCLPFKIGNNITEKMKMPANAVPDSTVITFVYKKGGKEVEFTADKFPADFSKDTYEFVRRYDKLVRAGKNNVPPVKGFNLSGSSNIDSTEYVLTRPYSLLLIAERLSGKGSWINNFEKLYQIAKAKNIPAFIITSHPDAVRETAISTGFNDIQVFTCDYKAIQTASRTDMCIYLLKNGTVVHKLSGREMGDMKKELNRLPVQEEPVIIPQINITDSIKVVDSLAKDQ